MSTDEDDSGAESPQFPPSNGRGAGGFRRVPNWLFFEQIEARRRRGESFQAMEAWCSLEYDLYRRGRLASEDAYCAIWKRGKGWVHRLIGDFRAEHGLPAPPRGRRPRRAEPPPARLARANPAGPIPGSFLDRTVDRISSGFTMPLDGSDPPDADRFADRSESTS